MDSEMGDVGSGRRSSERVLLVTGEDRDRELLGEWLADAGGYEVVTATTPEEIPDAYDLCIVDERSLPAFRPAFEDRVRAADPVYLPCLLLAADDGNRRGDGGTDRAAGALIDDVVSIPTDKRILRGRVENLLRARRASVRLAEREDQYRQLVELTPEAILLVDDGRIVYGNRAAARLLGVDDAETLEGRAMTAFAVEEDRATLRDLAAAADEDGRDRPSEFAELALRSDDGETVLAEAAAVAVTHEGTRMTQLIVRDLTERKRRERRLGLFERAIEASDQGITVADAGQADESLVYANPAFERITGYGLEGSLGRNCRFLQGEDTDPDTVARVRAAIDDERPVSVELLNYRRDGTPFWNRLDIVPVRNDEGTVTHFLGLQRDVTERKEREQRLSVLDRILRHNLSNKVSVIRGYAELIEEGSAEPGDAAGRIAEAAEELIALTEQVRAFRGVITAEERDLRRIDLVGAIEAATVDLRTLRPGSTLRLAVPDAAEVWAHGTLPGALRHLLALVDGTHEPRLDVRIEPGDRPLLEVIDRGGTLREADLRTASQHRETPLEHPQGLELWLVRWAVEYSGGSFCVDLDGDAPAIRMRFDRPPDRDA